jgi:glucose/arabinose dehydrogenase
MLLLLFACTRAAPDSVPPSETDPQDSDPAPFACTYVDEAWGPAGEVEIDVQVVAEGLATPWGLDWLPDGRMLLTERDGRISVVDGGVVTPVGTVDVTSSGEGGLLGLAVQNATTFFVYATVDGGGLRNQVQRWTLAGDQATFDAVVVDDIAARQFHNGGRIRIHDGHLIIGTGDAGLPSRSQDPSDPAGKVLRVTLDGAPAADNPDPSSPVYVLGVRNTQGFDWLPDGRMVITDHGPSGLPAEDGRSDHDEVTLASAGDNLGWPTIYACEEGEGLLTPSITFGDAMPPGGAALYTGTEIPEWQGDLLIGVMGFSAGTPHLHRLRLSDNGNVLVSEVYLSGTWGRLREVVMGPDGGLYVTTSNCDGRGTCGDGDRILRIGR